MHMRFITAVIAATVLAPATFAQILPGHAVATVIVTSLGSEMYDIDMQAGTATALTLSPALAAENVNCVLMTSPVTGFVGTNPASPATGNVYSIVITGGIVTETLLNTTATVGGNVAQMVEANGRLYFITQTSGVLGTLQSVPVGGGPVAIDLDLAALGAANLANACTAIGTKVYIATFNSGSAATAVNPGEVFEFDTVANTGRLVTTLPAGGYVSGTTTFSPGIVNMIPDTQIPGLLVLEGVYNDLIRVDPVNNTVVSAVWTGVLSTAGALQSATVNSFQYDPVARDFIIGTRNGAIERWVGTQQARQMITGVGSSATLTSNSVTGLAYIPFGSGIDESYGTGCPGNDNWTPTDSSFGAPIAGDPNFKLAVYSVNPGDPVLLLLDFQNVAIGSIPLPFDMTPIGAPGCQLLTGNLATRLALTTGSGSGNGRGVVPLPLPNSVLGLQLYRQWVELQLTPTNGLGLVTSNARRMVVQ